MFRQSPRRNPRNKGFNVKHALQICVLLAISIWLLYQVQHSHNKKAANVPEGLQNGKATIMLGRKDLQPQVEGSATEYVRHKEDQEEESRPDEQDPDEERVGEDGEHKSDFTDEESETEAQEEETDESKVTDFKEEAMEDREKETKEEAENGDKESTEESTASEKEGEREESKEEESGGKAIKEDMEIKENGSEKIQEKRGEENDIIENGDNKNGSEETQDKNSEGNDTTENGDNKENGNEETQEKSSEGNDTTENGDNKENGSEETKEKSSEENDYAEKGESKENKEEEEESKGSEEKELRDEKLIENEATGSEESEKRNADEKTRETREEREGTIENSGASENHKGENVSNEVAQETENIPESEGGITDPSNAGEQLNNNEGIEFEEKGTKNSEATSENENNSGLNVAGNAIIVKNDSALLVDSEGNKNETSLLEKGDSSNQTTGTTEYAAGKIASDPTSYTSQNKNITVDNVIPFGDITQAVLREQTEKPEEMTGGENSDLNSATPATENKGTVNGDSTDSFNNIEAVVLGQSANTSTSIEAQNNSEYLTGKEDNDSVQNQKSDTDSETSGTEYRELSNENINADSKQNNAGGSSTSETKEASSSPNDGADASKQSEVNSYISSKEASTDLATLPESHDHAAEK